MKLLHGPCTITQNILTKVIQAVWQAPQVGVILESGGKEDVEVMLEHLQGLTLV